MPPSIGRRRGARGGSRAPACGPCCIRAGPARPAACPRPSGRGRRRCRGSPRCGRSPARPSAASRLRSWRGASSSSQATRLASQAAISRFQLLQPAAAEVAVGVGFGALLGRDPGGRDARRCAAAPSARPAARRSSRPSTIPIASARWRARGFDDPGAVAVLRRCSASRSCGRFSNRCTQAHCTAPPPGRYRVGRREGLRHGRDGLHRRRRRAPAARPRRRGRLPRPQPGERRGRWRRSAASWSPATSATNGRSARAWPAATR